MSIPQDMVGRTNKEGLDEIFRHEYFTGPMLIHYANLFLNRKYNDNLSKREILTLLKMLRTQVDFIKFRDKIILEETAAIPARQAAQAAAAQAAQAAAAQAAQAAAAQAAAAQAAAAQAETDKWLTARNETPDFFRPGGGNKRKKNYRSRKNGNGHRRLMNHKTKSRKNKKKLRRN